MAAAAALRAAAGCGGSSSPSGDATLTIYASADTPAFAAGARAELAKHDGKAAGLPVTLVALSDATGGHWDPVRIAENARRASEDSTSIAYLGELEPGATRISEPITGQAGILQISGDEVRGQPIEDRRGDNAQGAQRNRLSRRTRPTAPRCGTPRSGTEPQPENRSRSAASISVKRNE